MAKLCRETGLTLEPTFLPFTPWTTLAGYCELLQTIDRLGLVEQVAPIQLAIRLLITEGSRLLELDGIRSIVQRFDAGSLSYRWAHADPRVDALQADLMTRVGTNLMIVPARDLRIGVGGRASGRRRRSPRRDRMSCRVPPSRISMNPGTVERNPPRSRLL